MKITKYVCPYTIYIYIYRYVDILFSLTKAIFIMFGRVTTYCQALKTWIGDNTTRYHNFNELPHALPHALLYILPQFSIVWGYLQRVTITSTCYHKCYRTFSISLAWCWAICNGLPRVVVKCRKKYILIFF